MEFFIDIISFFTNLSQIKNIILSQIRKRRIKYLIIEVGKQHETSIFSSITMFYLRQLSSSSFTIFYSKKIVILLLFAKYAFPVDDSLKYPSSDNSLNSTTSKFKSSSGIDSIFSYICSFISNGSKFSMTLRVKVLI